jgi:opacity protein-like surface antigen
MRRLCYGFGLLSGSVVVLCALFISRPAQAEFVGELYGGGAFTDKANVTDTSSLGATATFQGIKFDASGTGGGRFAYWFDEVGSIGAFGMGLDIFTFRTNVNQQTVSRTITAPGVQINGIGTIRPINISTVGIGFDLLRFRLHLEKSEEFQNGRVQPYFSVGPALFITDLSDTTNYRPVNQSKNNAVVGVKVGAGLNVYVTKTLSLFGEYRFTHFATEGTFQSTTPPASQETLRTDLNTHHLVGGVALHF